MAEKFHSWDYSVITIPAWFPASRTSRRNDESTPSRTLTIWRSVSAVRVALIAHDRGFTARPGRPRPSSFGCYTPSAHASPASSPLAKARPPYFQIASFRAVILRCAMRLELECANESGRSCKMLSDELKAGRRVLVEFDFPFGYPKGVAARRDVNEILDRAQVRINALAFSHLDSLGGLAPLFEGAPKLTSEQRHVVETEEAWMLGLGHVDAQMSCPQIPQIVTGSPPSVSWRQNTLSAQLLSGERSKITRCPSVASQRSM